MTINPQSFVVPSAIKRPVPHPYEAQHRMCAYLNPNGTFHLSGKQTYHWRDKIKSLGGAWDGKQWTVSREAVRQLKPLLHVKVRYAAHCHESAREGYATWKEVLAGAAREGCGMCDTTALCGGDTKILEILEPELLDLVDEFGKDQVQPK
jgi:hypothetical protein